MKTPRILIGTFGAAALALVALGSCSREHVAEERPGMAYIPPGEFLMGSAADDPDVYDFEKEHEQPQHKVDVKGFYIDKTEITNKAFDAFAPGHERDPKSACDDCPVTEVSWFQAKAYCEAQKKRLPTEAEWEKAAKGGSDKPFKSYDEYVWFARNTIENARPVGTKKPNAFGLYDMLGNVREWTADWYDPKYYQLAVRDNPKGPDTGTRRVERGGAFFLPQKGVTATIRYNHPPDFMLYFLGFRCAQDP